MVDFEWYRSFIAIYKHNSVTEAAKTRIMTQPAMSQHLASLEAEVGERLFTRTSRKLIPTERGKQLYAHLAPLIESLEERTMRLNAQLSPMTNTIRIGTTQELFTEKVTAQLTRLEWNTITHFGDADRLSELLKEDRVDIILTPKTFLTPGIEYVPLMQENYVLVAPAATAVPEFARLKDMEGWLSEQRWISYGLELPVIRAYWRAFFKKEPLINPVHVIPDLNVILRAIATGAGVSLLPTYMLKHRAAAAEPGWQIVCEQMTVRSELFVGFKSKHRHMLAIHEFIKRVCEQHEE